MKLLNKLKKDRQDLINNLNENIAALENIVFEQQKEIERLQGLLKEWKTAGYKYADSIDLIKTEAIKKYDKKLWRECVKTMELDSLWWLKEIRKQVLKEMVGDDNG